MKLKKWQKDRKAYAWAKILLPKHIEDLKENLKNSDDEVERFALSIEINRAEEDLLIIEEEYEKITNGSKER